MTPSGASLPGSHDVAGVDVPSPEWRLTLLADGRPTRRSPTTVELSHMGRIRGEGHPQRDGRWAYGLLAVLLVACGLSLGVASPSEALDLYALHGTVSDASGVALQGITIRNGGQVTTTDEAGTYRLGQLLPGTHTVRASSPCHNAEQETVTVVVPQDTQVDFTMTERVSTACGGVDSP